MLQPEGFALFAGLDAAGRRLLDARMTRRTVRAGGVVLRRGTRGHELLALASGRLAVDAVPGAPPLAIGPGEIVGEMSLLSGLPVSATVTAASDVELWVLPDDAFLKLVEEQPAARAHVMDVLVRRLRRSQDASATHRPQVAFVGLPRDRELGARWIDTLARAVRRHAPGSECVVPDSAESARLEIGSWRASPGHDAPLLVALPDDAIDALADEARPHDAVIRHDDAAARADAPFGAADRVLVRRAEEVRPDATRRWAHRLDVAELLRCADGAPPSRARAPALDGLARWIARKQIGVALSAGAALGFAHLGVLAGLDALGLPPDRIAGTSMGGVAGLMYGVAGGGEGGAEICVWALGRPRARRLSLFPRESVLSNRELRRRGEAIAGGRCLNDLSLPVSVVASDLVRGERVDVEAGRVIDAFFATTAVPGVLPPVREGARLLVDGALFTRLPVDLLPRSRCALRIAVNVIPAPRPAGDAPARAGDLPRRMGRPFGFVHALQRSWDLLGWWQGTRDAADADVLLEPRTSEHSGLEFARGWPALVQAGRDVVAEHADALRAAARPILAADDQD